MIRKVGAAIAVVALNLKSRGFRFSPTRHAVLVTRQSDTRVTSRSAGHTIVTTVTSFTSQVGDRHHVRNEASMIRIMENAMREASPCKL